MPKVINEIGNRYGKLLVIDRDGSKKGKAYWICKCDCGNITSACGTSLRRGKKKSCGCLERQVIDETGKRYGRLLVIKRVKKEDNKNAYWLCKCECGNETIVAGNNLRNGSTKSCGCYKSEQNTKPKKDLTEQIFGKLKAIKYEKRNKEKEGRWICICECGGIIKVRTTDLITGHTLSCGCLNSKGEYLISKYLKGKNINFIKQFTFDDLKDIKKLKFDFAVLDNCDNLICLIEFDGEQHFNKKSKFYNENIIKHDRQKDLYCLKNNIKLFRIKYDDDINEKLNNILDYIKEFC